MAYETPGVPTPEQSATAQRAKTAALPYENNGTSNPNPRRYDQCVEVPECDGPAGMGSGQVAQGNGPAYE